MSLDGNCGRCDPGREWLNERALWSFAHGHRAWMMVSPASVAERKHRSEVGGRW